MEFDKQKIFNKVIKHLRKQGKQAKNALDMCEYRSRSGLRCAVGCLIPKKHYSRLMEGSGLRTNVLVRDVLSKLFPKGLDFEGYGLLIALQDLHDDHWRWTKNGPREDLIKDIAEKFNLVYSQE